MENKILFIKILCFGMVGDLFVFDTMDGIMKICATGFYCVGIYVLLYSHIERNRNYEAWKKGGFKPEEKDKYKIK